MDHSIEPIRKSVITELPHPQMEPVPETAAPGLLQNVHRMLRGRYKWVILLAILLGAGGAYVGYQTWEPMYQSVGQIRIAPSVPRILYKVEGQDMSGAYDGFIGTQTTLLSSPRVIDFASQTPTWKKIGRPFTEDSVRDFRSKLNVSRPRGSQIINIAFTDEDPDAAHAAVRSIIDAYMDIFGEEEVKGRETVLNALEQRRIMLSAQLKSLQNSVHSIGDEMASRSLTAVYTYKLQLLHELESKLNQLQMERARFETGARAKGLIAAPAPEANETEGKGNGKNDGKNDAKTNDKESPVKVAATDEGADKSDEIPVTSEVQAAALKSHYTHSEIAQRDKVFDGMLQEQRTRTDQIDQLRKVRRDNHPVVEAAIKDLFRLEARIDQYAKEWNQTQVSQIQDAARREAIQQVQAMASNEQWLLKMIAPLKLEVQDLGRKDVQIGRLNDEIKEVAAKLKETETRLEHLSFESTVSGRLTIISKGERSNLPINLKARPNQAMMGGVGGAATALALFLLIGYLDGRTRYVDDVKTVLHRTPLLGVIPQVPAGKESVLSMSAAMAVNQVRALLQMGPVAAGRRAFAVVSGSPGEGKTSVTMALGTSFANSGVRTLLIDFDLAGRNLSALTGCVHRARLGEILKGIKHLSQEDIDRAITHARENGMRIGKAVVELGLATKDEVKVALSAQKGTALGVVDVLGGAPFSDCIVTTNTPRLWVLPVGEGGTEHLAGLSPTLVQRLIDRARQEYDIVLVDTGPVPASLEGSMIAAQVDDAVMVVSKDSRQSSVQRALEHLKSINTTVAGIVFNRAKTGCVDQYGSSSTRLSYGMSRPNAAFQTGRESNDMGPLATATARSAMDPEGGEGISRVRANWHAAKADADKGDDRDDRGSSSATAVAVRRIETDEDRLEA